MEKHEIIINASALILNIILFFLFYTFGKRNGISIGKDHGLSVRSRIINASIEAKIESVKVLESYMKLLGSVEQNVNIPKKSKDSIERRVCAYARLISLIPETLKTLKTFDTKNMSEEEIETLELIKNEFSIAKGQIDEAVNI